MTPPGIREEILSGGAQAERTRLSWNRTALAIAVNAALLTHTGGTSLARHIAAMAVFIAAVGCFIFADRRYRQINAAVRSGRRVTVVLHVRTVGLLAFAPALIALGAILETT